MRNLIREVSVDSIPNGSATRLVFEARVTGAKPVLAKADQYGGGSGGRLELTLTLDQPKAPAPPRAPTPDYRFRDPHGDGMCAKPADIPRKKGESDEEYEAREAVVKRRQEQLEWGNATTAFGHAYNRYMDQKVAHAAALLAHRERTMSYAQLVGIASVFGNMAMKVELTPLEQDLLPGFSVGLLPEPAGGE
jgi:hypothetical protein